MKRPATEPLDDTVVTYAWDEAELAQVEAYVNSLPPAIGHNSIPAGMPPITGSASAEAMAAAEKRNGVVGIGHNSRRSFVDPGEGTDYVLDGPLKKQRDKLKQKDLELFLKAIATQGSAAIRLTAIDNAVHRYRALKGLAPLSYKALEQIASRCKWRFRYHFETAETLGFFIGTDGSNMLRAIRPLAEKGAIAIIDLPRKDGGHPVLCFAIVCTDRDRADSTITDLYAQLYAEREKAEREKGKPSRHSDDLTIDQVVDLTTRQVVNLTSCPPSSRQFDEPTSRQFDDYRAEEERAEKKRDTGADAPPLPFVNDANATVPAADTLPRQPSTTSTPKPTSKRRSPKADPEEDPEVIAALAAYNALEVPHARASMSADRSDLLRKRLDEIGGLENFKLALTAIRFDDWLAGKVPPQPGRSQFKLELEYLLSTKSKKGNILVKLLDAAHDAAVKPSAKPSTTLDPTTLSDAAWNAYVRDYRENGAWPAGIGPKPDEPGCLAPPEILKKYGYTTKKGSGA